MNIFLCVSCQNCSWLVGGPKWSDIQYIFKNLGIWIKYLALIFSYLLNYCIWIWLWNRVMLQLAHHWSQHCLNEVVEGGQMSQKFWLDILNIFKVATKVGHFSWYILYQFLSLSPLYIFFIYFEIFCFTYFKIHLRAMLFVFVFYNLITWVTKLAMGHIFFFKGT